MLQLFLSLIFFTTVTAIKTNWTCTIIASAPLADGATWSKQNCTSPSVPSGKNGSHIQKVGPVIINVVIGNLSSNLQLVPLTAASNTVTPLPNMTNPTPNKTKLLAGINAAYFYRVDETHFFDNVCLGKLKKIALLPVTTVSPNHGVSDGAIVRNGKVLGSNCDCLGENRVAVLSVNGTNSRIDVLLKRGDPPPFGIQFDAIGAGPNLITKSNIAIPPHDQNFANVYEHSANTGVGFRTTFQTREVVMITTDGHDGCKINDTTCGMNAFTLAYLMRDAFQCDSAMGMDQGGSTTMWIHGKGVVSNLGSSARPIFSGLFLVEKKDNKDD